MENLIENPPDYSKINTFTIVHGEGKDIALVSWGDRLIVQEDKFKTGYECKDCDGAGHTAEVCNNCGGTKTEMFDNVPTRCRACSAGTSDGVISYGYKLCPTCKGKGGLVIAPEESQRRPSSGIVRSIGGDVKYAKVGDHILYTNFAGHKIDFKQKTVLRILREHEIVAQIFGVGKIQEELI